MLEVQGFVEQRHEAWNLFQDFASISIQQKTALAETLPDPQLFDFLYTDPENSKRKLKIKYKVEKLGEHHFFELLEWNPRGIKTAAKLL